MHIPLNSEVKSKKYLNAYYDVRLAKEWNGREIYKRYETDTEEKEGKEKYSLGIIWIIFFLHFPAFFHSHALLSLFAYYTYCLLDKHHSNSGEAVRSLLLPTMEQMHNVLWLYPLENDDNNNEYIFFLLLPLSHYTVPTWLLLLLVIHLISELMILGVAYRSNV